MTVEYKDKFDQFVATLGAVRSSFHDHIYRDHATVGMDFVRAQMDRKEWLWLMGLYDTMFIEDYENYIDLL